MTPWLAATIGLLPPLAVVLWVACRDHAGGRLAAVQMASSLGVWAMVLMSFAFDQSTEMDLPLLLALLSLPGTVLLALFLERWV